MPIHFRCAFCNQLLGIARRKAGSVINCPTCGGPLVVPQLANDEAKQSPAKSPAERLLEDYDVDVLLKPPQPAQAVGASVRGELGATASSHVDATEGVHPSGQRGSQIRSASDGAGADTPAHVTLRQQGFFVTTTRATLLAILFALLLAAAFVAGFFLGRGGE